MFQRTFLTGLAITLLVVQACGSDDGKKRSRSAAEGGAGGEAGPDMGQDAAGAAGTPPVNDGGTGGTGDIVDVGGTGGVGGTEEPPIPAAGAGGEAPLPPNPELLFGVKYGAHGLADTAVSKQATPENFIYTTSTASQDAVDGTNAVKVTGEALGLGAADAIVAFAEEQLEPQNPMFLFTLADGSEGAYGTRSYQAEDSSGTEESQLYYSEGTLLYDSDGGEGSINYKGYNGLTATESSLGLNNAAEIDANPDDLQGLAVHDANKELEELYFTVTSEAVGATDSGVDLVDADHKACTVFKSSLDGTNSVAFTCEQLGLTTTDQIDALAVFRGNDGPTVIFSVSSASQGAAGTILATLREEGEHVGATLFRSVGDTTNTVYRLGEALGLDEDSYDNDNVDGLAIIEQPKATESGYGTCDLAYDPYAANAGNVIAIDGTTSIGANVLVVVGSLDQAGGGARLLAYDATTCQFLQQVDLPTEFENAQWLTIAPLPGWTPSKPLEKVEYFRAVPDGYQIAVRRHDAAGEFLAQMLVSSSYYAGPVAFFYDPTGDQLVLTTSEYAMAAFPRPASDATAIDATFHKISRPCADQGNVGGVDSDGNVYIARSQQTASTFRVCGYRPDGEMLPVPYGWSSDVDDYVGGFIVPGGSHFLFHSGEPMWIERTTFPKL